MHARTLLGLPRQVALVVALLTIVMSAAWAVMWGLTPRSDGDTGSYQEVAVDLRDGRMDSLHDRPPGYPIVLLLTGSADRPSAGLQLLQLVAHGAAVWLALCLLQRFRPSAAVSMLTAALMLSPPLVEKAAWAMTESISELLVVATTLVLVRWLEQRRLRQLVGVGLLCGALAVVHPMFVLLGLCIGVAAAVVTFRSGGGVPRAARAGAAALLGAALLVAPVVLHNAVRFDHAVVTPMTGWSLSTRTALFVDELPASEPLRSLLVEARNENLVDGESHTGLMYIWGARRDVAAQLDVSDAEASDYLLAMNLRLIASQPLDYLSAVGTAAAGYTAPATMDTASGSSSVAKAGLALVHYALVLAWLLQLVGVVGVVMSKRLGAPVSVRALRASLRTWLVCLLVAGYSAVMSVTIDVGNPRHRTPTELILLVGLVGGWIVVRRAFRSSPASALQPS
jgi:hypothetical protein